MNDAESLLAEGLAAFRARAYADALSAWRKLLEIEPDHQVAELVRHAEMMANDVDDVEQLHRQIDELRAELSATRSSRNELLMEMARLHQHYDEQEQRLRRAFEAKLWKLREQLADAQLATLDTKNTTPSAETADRGAEESTDEQDRTSATTDALVTTLRQREIRLSIQNRILQRELRTLQRNIAVDSTSGENSDVMPAQENAESSTASASEAPVPTTPQAKTTEEHVQPTSLLGNDVDTSEPAPFFEDLAEPTADHASFELEEATIPNEPAFDRGEATPLLDEEDADDRQPSPDQTSASSSRFHTTATPLLDEEDVDDLSETLFETPEPPRLQTGIVPQLPELDFEPETESLRSEELPERLDWIPTRQQNQPSVSPIAAYLMTHVDGASSFRELSNVVGLPQNAVIQGFQELIEAGAILARQP